MKPLHVYTMRNIANSMRSYYVIYRYRGPVATVVWQGQDFGYANRDAQRRALVEAFDECCRRNGARPRRARFIESVILAAQLRAMDPASH